ncbi:hypothetical protein GCM10027034_27690 [Ramlibacter solisilvae]|uniref:HutD family protein n=1 Tax=Ramlibacter tataouinensis TaxID=94132 RepID=A0A127JR18_9BURK|nr:HutD family protein [Ramlibacter tataouinensis]AMO22417.1 hypothetical protein UC35_05265 [Ramlibacter tataouinensis]
MKWELVALDAVAPQAWRNGGGLTRELLAWPTAAAWRLRLSVADVNAAGPFSPFPGIERWFAVLEGDGVVLRMDGEDLTLTSAEAPLRFDGGRSVDCALRGGATRDFNLMAPPGRARMWRARGRHRFDAPEGSLLAAYAHAASARVQVAGEALELPPRHLAWTRLDAPASGELASEDALWMEATL